MKQRVYRELPNQLHPELLSLCSLQPWDGANSSARKYMLAGHLAQTLPIANPTEKRNQSGMERQYGKYTNNIKMPEDGKIIKVLDLYPKSYGAQAIPQSPLTLVIYEEYETGTIGCIEITDYCYNYSYYGFAYQRMPGMTKLRDGEYVAKDTLFMDSTAVTDDGAYRFGRECNVAFISDAATAEDAIVISRDVLPDFAYRTYEKRTISWGKDKFPINLYGDDNNYKPFPDIGEYVHPKGQHSGLIMALREYDEDLAVIDQNITSVRYPDVLFDQCTYAAGAGGKVVDIRIHHDNNSRFGGTDPLMSEQPIKYDRARRQFYEEVITVYKRLLRERGEGLSLSPEFHRIVIEAIAIVGISDNKLLTLSDRVEMIHRKKPLDEWQVEFTIEYYHIPGIGAKATDMHGGKGVICEIREREDMPVDEFGNKVDIILDPNTTFSRMNLGRLFEQYLNSASTTLTKQLKQHFVKAGFPELLENINRVNGYKKEDGFTALFSHIPQEVFDTAWQRLMRYYEITSPRQAQWFKDGTYPNTPQYHMGMVLREGIYLHIPTDNEPEYMEYITQIENEFHPEYGYLKWRNKDGSYTTSKEKVRVASLYILLLEKTGSEWAATASGKVQQHGVLTPLSHGEKFATPARQQPARSLDESIIRNFSSYVDPFVTADVLDRNNNPEAHKEIVKTILAAPQPTNIEEVIDRNKFPLGYSKPLQIMKHLSYCAGYEFHYKPVTQVSNKPKIQG